MNSGLCILQDAVSRTESCPGSPCPYWQDEIDRGCVVAPIQRQLRDQPKLAQHLLELRANLDRARHGGGQEKGRRLFYRLLNEEQAAETSECQLDEEAVSATER
jgi:hypothetical protein